MLSMITDFTFRSAASRAWNGICSEITISPDSNVH